jgi:hypothetical protein
MACKIVLELVLERAAFVARHHVTAHQQFEGVPKIQGGVDV